MFVPHESNKTTNLNGIIRRNLQVMMPFFEWIAVQRSAWPRDNTAAVSSSRITLQQRTNQNLLGMILTFNGANQEISLHY